MDENKNKNENFNIVGLPSVDDIEVEEPVQKKPISRGKGFDMADLQKHMQEELANLTPEKMKKMLPEDMLKELEKQLHAEDPNANMDDVLNASAALLKAFNITPSQSADDLLGGILSSLGLSPDDVSEEETEEEEENKQPVFFDRKWLYNNVFGSVPCLTSANLFDEFVDRYGKDGKTYLDPVKGIKTVKLSETTENIPLELIEELQYCFSTDRYILFYAKPFKSEEQAADPTLADFGFFMAAIKQENGEFALIVPEYGNTMDYNEEDGCFVYDELYGEEMFLDGNGNFIKVLSAVLNFSIKFMLAPIKNILLSPLQFGTIKNQKVAIKGSSQWLQIGTITSNESSEAILFKKDADLDLKETVFPFYIKLSENTLEENLRLLQDALYNTDLNQAAIFKYSELRFTSTGELYIDVDLSDLDN